MQEQNREEKLNKNCFPSKRRIFCSALFATLLSIRPHRLTIDREMEQIQRPLYQIHIRWMKTLLLFFIKHRYSFLWIMPVKKVKIIGCRTFGRKKPNRDRKGDRENRDMTQYERNIETVNIAILINLNTLCMRLYCYEGLLLLSNRADTTHECPYIQKSTRVRLSLSPTLLFSHPLYLAYMCMYCSVLLALALAFLFTLMASVSLCVYVFSWQYERTTCSIFTYIQQ